MAFETWTSATDIHLSRQLNNCNNTAAAGIWLACKFLLTVDCRLVRQVYWLHIFLLHDIHKALLAELVIPSGNLSVTQTHQNTGGCLKKQELQLNFVIAGWEVPSLGSRLASPTWCTAAVPACLSRERRWASTISHAVELQSSATQTTFILLQHHCFINW